jgi:hypothetical protein
VWAKGLMYYVPVVVRMGKNRNQFCSNEMFPTCQQQILLAAKKKEKMQSGKKLRCLHKKVVRHALLTHLVAWEFT